MTETAVTQSLPDMHGKQATVSWKTFFVLLSGKTNRAHHDFVEKLKDVGHTEVDSPEECDYLLVFCPVASRVGTDIKDAMNKMTAGKPIILVVMHHTFNSDSVVAESRRLVTNPNVHLTVDCLFYETKFLECNRNDIAWFEVQNYLGVSVSQVSVWQKCKNLIRRNWNPLVYIGLALTALAIVVLGAMFIKALFEIMEPGHDLKKLKK